MRECNIVVLGEPILDEEVLESVDLVDRLEDDQDLESGFTLDFE